MVRVRTHELHAPPAVKIYLVLGYSSRNHKLKCREPHFQRSAPRSGWKEISETAVALLHSWECIKEPISALPNNGLLVKFGARAELRNILQAKLRGRGGFSCRFDRRFGHSGPFWKTAFMILHRATNALPVTIAGGTATQVIDAAN